MCYKCSTKHRPKCIDIKYGKSKCSKCNKCHKCDNNCDSILCQQCAENYCEGCYTYCADMRYGFCSKCRELKFGAEKGRLFDEFEDNNNFIRDKRKWYFSGNVKVDFVWNNLHNFIMYTIRQRNDELGIVE